ncbi:MAG: hypothetical protein ACLTC4_07705 [Hungatella hathewayi]
MVAASKQDDFLVIQIRDNGKRMTKEEMEALLSGKETGEKDHSGHPGYPMSTRDWCSITGRTVNLRWKAKPVSIP